MSKNKWIDFNCSWNMHYHWWNIYKTNHMFLVFSIWDKKDSLKIISDILIDRLSMNRTFLHKLPIEKSNHWKVESEKKIHLWSQGKQSKTKANYHCNKYTRRGNKKKGQQAIQHTDDRTQWWGTRDWREFFLLFNNTWRSFCILGYEDRES